MDGQNAVTYTYYPDADPNIGKLESVTTADGVGLSYTYDGPLTLSEALSDPVSGTYSLDYNNDFRVETGTVENANFSYSVGYDYDDDGLSPVL